jgi:hypothetical protein
MPTALEAHLRHSRYYLECLKTISGVPISANSFDPLYAPYFRDEWLQIQRGRAWASQYANVDLSAAMLLSDYATTCSTGSLLLNLLLTPVELISWLEDAIRGARLIANRQREASHLYQLGLNLTLSRGAQHSLPCLERSASLFECAGDLHGACCALNATALLLHAHLNRIEDASERFACSLELARSNKHLSDQVHTLNYLGILNRKRGLYSDAFANHQEGRKLSVLSDSPLLQAMLLFALGMDAIAISDVTSANAYFADAMSFPVPDTLNDGDIWTTIYGEIGVQWSRLNDPRAEQVLDINLRGCQTTG